MDGVLIEQRHTRSKFNSIRYVANAIDPPFKVFSVEGSIMVPVSIRTPRKFKGGMKRIFTKANLIAEMDYIGKTKRQFGFYNEAYQRRVFPFFDMPLFCMDLDTLYTLDPFTLNISAYDLKSSSMTNTIQLKYKTIVPEGLSASNMEFRNREKAFKQKIESSNASDIFKWKKNFYLLYSDLVRDTCEVGSVLSRPKKGCYVASFKERNQWVLYYHKPVYLLKFDESGSYISKQLIEIYNDCEVLKIHDNAAYIYSRTSDKGGKKIVKVNLE